MNKTEEKKLIQKLRRKCYFLWRRKVIDNAKGKCEYCEKTEKLNAHHIESYSLNKDLRYDPHNGVCFCSTCHKFGRLSAHKSFIFMYKFMTEKRHDDLLYLMNVYKFKFPETIESLKKIIDIYLPVPMIIKRIR
jgi:5-methylcytosine-specific restriction endonuclease McrA